MKGTTTMVGVSGLTDNERFVLTKSGYEILQHELEVLEARQREDLANFADVNYSNDPSKEEASYFETRIDKEHTDQRVVYLRTVLNNAEVVDEDPNIETVDPGDRVTVWDFTEKRELKFDLIGSPEAVAGRRGVSLASPVGKALLGRRIGDVIEIEVPDGSSRYAIRNIERMPDDAGLPY
jgi:transcription elongation factor GreA